MCEKRFCWGPYFMAQLPYRTYIFHYIYGPHPSYARVIYSDPWSVKITLSRFALRSLRYVGWNFRRLCERHFQDFLWLAMQFIVLLQEILSSQEKYRPKICECYSANCQPHDCLSRLSLTSVKVLGRFVHQDERKTSIRHYARGVKQGIDRQRRNFATISSSVEIVGHLPWQAADQDHWGLRLASIPA